MTESVRVQSVHRDGKGVAGQEHESAALMAPAVRSREMNASVQFVSPLFIQATTPAREMVPPTFLE